MGRRAPLGFLVLLVWCVVRSQRHVRGAQSRFLKGVREVSSTHAQKPQLTDGASRHHWGETVRSVLMEDPLWEVGIITDKHRKALQRRGVKNRQVDSILRRWAVAISSELGLTWAQDMAQREALATVWMRGGSDGRRRRRGYDTRALAKWRGRTRPGRKQRKLMGG